MRPAGSDISDPYSPGRLEPVAPAAIFIGFGERDAIMTTGWCVHKGHTHLSPPSSKKGPYQADTFFWRKRDWGLKIPRNLVRRRIE